jgi:hypothetical protein
MTDYGSETLNQLFFTIAAIIIFVSILSLIILFSDPEFLETKLISSEISYLMSLSIPDKSSFQLDYNNIEKLGSIDIIAENNIVKVKINDMKSYVQEPFYSNDVQVEVESKIITIK